MDSFRSAFLKDFQGPYLHPPLLLDLRNSYLPGHIAPVTFPFDLLHQLLFFPSVIKTSYLFLLLKKKTIKAFLALYSLFLSPIHDKLLKELFVILLQCLLYFSLKLIPIRFFPHYYTNIVL